MKSLSNWWYFLPHAEEVEADGPQGLQGQARGPGPSARAATMASVLGWLVPFGKGRDGRVDAIDPGFDRFQLLAQRCEP